MFFNTYKSVSGAFLSQLYLVTKCGEKVAPRGIRTLETMFNRIILEDITDIEVFDYKFSDLQVALSAVCATASKNDLSSKYGHFYTSSRYFRDDYDVFAYKNGSSLLDIIATLSNDVNSRQAILSFGDKFCTNSIMFYIRGGKLHSMINSRSIDLIKKFVTDMQYFCYLQQILANTLGLQYGSLIWNIGSLHIYEGDLVEFDPEKLSIDWLKDENKSRLRKTTLKHFQLKPTTMIKILEEGELYE